jgi:hypothetical protein
MTGKRVFISYRRSDSAGYAGRLYDTLKDHFGEDRIFFDVDTIKPGVDFEQKIKTELDSSSAILVLIGRHWLDAKDASGNPRLENPNDYIRLEVETALAKNIAVIPVLLQGVPVPSGKELPEKLYDLSRRNAIKLSDENWNSDLNLLTAILKNILGVSGSLKEQRIKRYRQVVFALSLLGALLSIANNFILTDSPAALRSAIRFLYLVILAGTTVFCDLSAGQHETGAGPPWLGYHQHGGHTSNVRSPGGLSGCTDAYPPADRSLAGQLRQTR